MFQKRNKAKPTHPPSNNLIKEVKDLYKVGNWEKKEYLFIVGGNVNCVATIDNTVEVSQNTNKWNCLTPVNLVIWLKETS